MEKYREKLKLDNIILAIGAAILALFSLLALAAELEWVPFPVPAAGDGHWQSMWRGFISGASTAMLLFMVFGLVRNLRALKNDALLKKNYVKDHDERAILVVTNARSAGMQAFLLLGLVAAIIAGYFSISVGLTLLACVLSASLLCAAFKFYYHKKL